MKSRVVQLCIDMSTLNMVAITQTYSSLEEIVKIVTGIRREGRRTFRDQRTNEHEKMHAIYSE